MTPDQHKAIIRDWVERAWNQGDVSIASGLYAATYELHGAGSPASVRGAEGIAQYVQAFRTGFPDLHFDVDPMVAEGDKVAWHMTARGTHNGELFGIPPTGRPTVVTATVISRFEDGTWAEDWAVVDQLGMLQQLGVIAAREPAAR